MNKNMKKTVKILITVLMVIGILLILPKTENAAEVNLNFKYYEKNFTINCSDTHFYALAHDLLTYDFETLDRNNKWTIGKSVGAGNIEVNGESYHDGTYLMGGGKSSGAEFIPNGYCGQEENSGSGNSGKIEYILDISPNEISLQSADGKNKVVSRSEIANEKISSWNNLNKLAYVLGNVYTHNNDSSYVWGTDGETRYLRGGLGYLRNYADDENIKNDLKRILGFKPNLPITGRSDETLNITGNNIYHVRIYFINIEGGQPRFIFKAEVADTTPEVEVKISKQDFSGNSLSKATISIEKGDNVSSIDKTSMTIGNGTVTVEPTSSNPGWFKLKIKETTAPTGYQKYSNEIILTVYYNKISGNVTKITSSNTTYVPNIAESATDKTVIVKNKPKANLIINKTDSLTGDKLKDAKFKIELTNVGAITGYSVTSSGKATITEVATDKNGQIKLTGIVPKSVGTKITATITEVGVPTANGYYYEKIDPIKVEFKYSNKTWVKVTGNITINSNTVSVGIKNTPLITLSGNVWQDAQRGEKVVSGADGLRNQYYKYNKVNDGEGDYTVEYDDEGNVIFTYVGESKGNYTREETISEGFLDGVLVELYNADANGNKTGNRVAFTTTKNGGKYEFKGIRKTSNGYIVVFKYDGINYKATAQNVGIDEANDSDVAEQNRNTINNNIKTISANSANETVPLSYKENEPILNVNMDGTNPANKNAADFQVEAYTGVYKDSNSNITCGLVKKELDLAVGTDIKEATLKINEKETKYTYAQIMNGEMEDLSLDGILQNNSSSNNGDIQYNLYLYSSDYNYRIADYNTGITNNVNNDGYDYTADSTLKNLEAYVTYSVILKNQTTYKATVDQFVYYYDSIYTPMMVVGDVIDGYKVTSIENNKITFENAGENNALSEANSYRKEINLTFKLDVNSEAYKNLITTSREAKNVVEITKYSTGIGGLIDKDSAPGNANVTFTNGTLTVGKYEDDTDEAKGITISVGNKGTRTITGTVFDDKDKYGILNNEDTVVNDVIVQLIEIKKVSGQYYEYIWQETRSGSNQVKTTARNGYVGTTYTNSVQQGSGQYEFKDYIPGNYIIRFIYGDGSTYDLTDNVKTYNGQDYKSTTDENYKETWYNNVMYNTTKEDITKYSENSSVARDNEARRLEVMAYSATIDQEVGKALEEKTSLDKTWMAAETSRINVPVDADDTSTDSSSTTVSYRNIGNTVNFGTVHFGLALRPETKLVLEKHITGLKITPSGTGVQSIIDARADIEQIINDTTVDVTGITTGLATIKSESDERGFWKVETDIEELAQGAQLEVEYTYVIRNESDEDYLSSTLVKAYKSQDIKSYSATLGEIKDTVKTTMRNGTYSYGNNNVIGNYLGQYYYTGTPANNTDLEVLSRVEELEESLNNQLKYDEEVSGEDFAISESNVENNPIYDTDGNPATVTTETVVKTTSTSEFLRTAINDKYSTEDAKWHDKTVEGNDNVVPNADYSKTLRLTTVLTSFNNGEGYYPSYIAEITKYSNAAGRRNMSAEPDNLSYVHSNDTNMTLTNSWLYDLDGKTLETQDKESIPEGATNIREANEEDEFWGEQIIISKPTGNNKQLAMQIAIITISSIAVIGVGIVLIKKFVLKK